jgi:hypothetical protein
MIKQSIILFLLWSTQLMQAQSITKPEANAIADRLLDAAILSDSGRLFLRSYIASGDLAKVRTNFWSTEQKTPDSSLYKSQILFFCSVAFNQEWFYRSGEKAVNDQIEVLQEIYGWHVAPPELYDSVRTNYFAHFDKTVEYGIEQEIAGSDPPAGERPGNTGNVSFSIFSSPGISFDNYGLVHNKCSVLGKSRTKILATFLKIGLIDTLVYEECKKTMKDYDTEGSISLFAGKRTAWFENFSQNKQRQIEFIHKLNQKKILSDINTKKVLESYGPFEIKDKFDIIRYCEHAKIYDVGQLPKGISTAYTAVFNDLKSIIPGFDYKNLTFQLQKDPETNTSQVTFLKLVVSLDINGLRYSYKSHYTIVFTDSLNSIASDSVYISPGFHDVINKWLAETGSLSRLYYVNKQDDKDNIFGKKTFGLIFLPSELYNDFHNGNEMDLLFAADFSNVMQPDKQKKSVDAYKSAGLFNQLTPAEITEGMICVRDKEVENYVDILDCFPTIMVRMEYDFLEQPMPYSHLLRSFAKLSGGFLMPTQITENSEDQVSFSFENRGKKYASVWETGVFPDESFLALLRSAIQDFSPEYNVYGCYVDGIILRGYTVLSEPQYIFLKEVQPGLLKEW